MTSTTKREIFYLVDAAGRVVWSDTADSPLALPDSRTRWNAIWANRETLAELCHSHPIGPNAFSHEDITTMDALDAALGKAIRFSLVSPKGYFLRGPDNRVVPSPPPAWAERLRAASGMESFVVTRISSWLARPPDDTSRLEPLVDALQRPDVAAVIFVCTHNSRRSQLAEVLARVLALHFGHAGLTTCSAGTEATAFDRRAVSALVRVGITPDNDLVSGPNPHYRFAGASSFSKTLDHPSLPTRNFVAVMVCSNADAACPVVFGATRRVSLPFLDPKLGDGTEAEAATYDQRLDDIARALTWVFSQLRTRTQPSGPASSPTR